MHLELQIYDAVGRFVQTVISESVEAGYHEIPFEMHGLSAGVYFYRGVASRKRITKQRVNIKPDRREVHAETPACLSDHPEYLSVDERRRVQEFAHVHHILHFS